ncbi:hypothetical protein ASD65_10410 [Microbacterium sp. Root61]|nr:hypothetical protein ASD65_10410 [Microbacterium sp. Root61]
MSAELSGRVAIVTGAAGQYGRHISRALAGAGATVVIASRQLDACEEFAAELRDEGASAVAIALDQADESSITTFVGEVIDRLGRIDVLVNNAVLRRGGVPAETTYADWAATSTVNSTGLFWLTTQVAERMAAAGRGSIINIASIYAMIAPDFSLFEETAIAPTPPFYAFDKAGMLGLTRYFAAYYGPSGVRVNAISAGGLLSDAMDPAFIAGYSRRTALRRPAGPDDIKGPLLFLASDASGYVTGINLPVDGGRTL